MSFSRADLGALAGLLRDVARSVVMPRFRRLSPGAVRCKTGPLDLVTDADEAAERAITDRLGRLFPGCLVVGEEAASADPRRLDGLAEAALAFTVDPIDGTSNFAAGLPLFGTMAAAIERGRIVAAAIYDPVGDDTALALAGHGAWIETPDGVRTALRVAPPADLAQMTGTASFRFLPEPLRSRVCSRLPCLAASWDYRCAAHEYRMTAAGHGHFLLFNRLLPWDHAPGWLLHREAGGYSARFDGSPYAPAVTEGGLLCAPDRASWEVLRAALLT
jgi:fructose-1,6-bisphosphatase/inositol monophosphatase family enzyme